MQTYSTPTSNGPSTAGGASGAADQAKDKASQAAGQAKEQAAQAADQAKGQLRSQVDQRSTQAGEKVNGFASDVRSVGDQLREQGKDQPAKIADQAAQRAEKVASYLTDNDSDRILGDIEDYGRRNPWAVIAGSVMLGLAASRFLKASSSRRYEQRSSTGTYRGGQLPQRSTYGSAYDTPSSYDTPSTIQPSPVTAGPTTTTTPGI